MGTVSGAAWSGCQSPSRVGRGLVIGEEVAAAMGRCGELAK